MAESPVLVEVEDGIAVITLNRPKQRNAMNKELTNKLRQAILECDKNPSVKCSILTGAGKAFCAGIDLKEFGAGRGIDPRARQNAQGGGEGQPDVAPHWLMNGKKKPIIAAVNGPTITGGLEVALNCDFIIASEHATFADTHARVGVMPGGGLTVLLPQWIGLPRARQMSITGNFVNAKQALEWGLANEVVPEAELLPRCKALAAAICQIDPKAVTQMLDTYEDTTGGTAKDAWQVEQTKKSGFTESDGAAVAGKYEGIRSRGAKQFGGSKL